MSHTTQHADSVAVIAGLRKHFCPPAWVLLEQVGNSTGGRCRGWGDAVAMNLWPSRGLEIVGFEVKVARGDWIKELRDPAKAENISRYCDRWYLAVSDADLVRPGELPTPWGLFVLNGDGVKCHKEAAVNPNPVPVDRGFIGVVLRRAVVDVSIEGRLKAEYDRGYKAGLENGEANGKSEYDMLVSEMKGIRSNIAEFEKASGVSIANGWTKPEAVGDAVCAVLSGADKQAEKRLQRLLADAESVVEFIRKQVPKGTTCDAPS